MARAQSGTIYLADRSNHRIRAISPTGTVSLLAGSGSYGSTNGAAAQARFAYPSGVAVQASGATVYVADSYNHRIRRISTSGQTQLIAGASSGAQDGIGAGARFSYPSDVSVRDDGDACTTDSCNTKTGCSHTAVQNCCNPIKKLWKFSSTGEGQGWTFRKCSASTSYYAPAGCTTYVPNPSTKGWQIWTASPIYKSKAGALYYGDIKAQNFNFGSSAGTARTPNINVPQGAATLKFSIYAATESGYKYDKASVFLYVNGSRVNVQTSGNPAAGALWYKGQPGTTKNTWYTVQLNVSKYAGSNVQLEFYFNTGDAKYNATKGLFVDDVQLIGSCPK